MFPSVGPAVLISQPRSWHPRPWPFPPARPEPLGGSGSRAPGGPQGACDRRGGTGEQRGETPHRSGRNSRGEQLTHVVPVGRLGGSVLQAGQDLPLAHVAVPHQQEFQQKIVGFHRASHVAHPPRRSPQAPRRISSRGPSRGPGGPGDRGGQRRGQAAACPALAGGRREAAARPRHGSGGSARRAIPRRGRSREALRGAPPAATGNGGPGGGGNGGSARRVATERRRPSPPAEGPTLSARAARRCPGTRRGSGRSAGRPRGAPSRSGTCRPGRGLSARRRLTPPLGSARRRGALTERRAPPPNRPIGRLVSAPALLSIHWRAEMAAPPLPPLPRERRSRPCIRLLGHQNALAPPSSASTGGEQTSTAPFLVVPAGHSGPVARGLQGGHWLFPPSIALSRASPLDGEGFAWSRAARPRVRAPASPTGTGTEPSSHDCCGLISRVCKNYRVYGQTNGPRTQVGSQRNGGGRPMQSNSSFWTRNISGLCTSTRPKSRTTQPSHRRKVSPCSYWPWKSLTLHTFVLLLGYS